MHGTTIKKMTWRFARKGFHENRSSFSVNLLAKYGIVGLSTAKKCGVVKWAVMKLHKKGYQWMVFMITNLVIFTVRLRQCWNIYLSAGNMNWEDSRLLPSLKCSVPSGRYVQLHSSIFLNATNAGRDSRSFEQTRWGPRHFYNQVTSYLDKLYRSQWTRRGDRKLRPPSSPDLRPTDVFLLSSFFFPDSGFHRYLRQQTTSRQRPQRNVGKPNQKSPPSPKVWQNVAYLLDTGGDNITTLSELFFQIRWDF